jgi:fructokinase
MSGIEIVGVGELLWDLLPGGRQLGGAPCNFVFHCQRLGHTSVMLSRVGADQPGRELRSAALALGLDDSYLQEDPDHPTGSARVAVDAQGQPTFNIVEDVAYDYLAWEDRFAPLLAAARAVCFGSLAQRHAVARATILRAVGAAPQALAIFDVNLRQRYFDRDLIETSLAASRWVKLSSDELPVLRDLLGLAGAAPHELLHDLRRRFQLEVAILTRGAEGCLVQSAAQEIDLPGVPVTVVDTVGAGDAFSAGLLAYVLEGRALADAAAFANRLAARVAASAGATPLLQRNHIEGQGPIVAARSR